MNSNLPFNFTTHCPLIHSPFDISNDDGLIAPSSPKFFVDDDGKYFIDDSGAMFISEN